MPTFAFAGSGHITAVWGQALGQLRRHQVVAVASRDPANAATRAAQLRCRACTYDELPAGADIVVVATPPALHAAHAEAAIAGGAAVIVEKPLAPTLREADRLVAAAQAGARIGYGENLLFSPYVREAVRRCRELGPLVHLGLRSLHSPPGWGEFFTDGWGGGVLFDVGVHPLAVLLAAVGDDPPIAVRARLEGGDGHATDERAEVWVTFASGLTAHVEVSWRAESPLWDLQAASATSALRLELLPDPHLEQLGVDLPPPRRRYPPELTRLETFGYLNQALELASELTTPGAEPYVGAAFGRAVLEIVCAAYRSAGRGEAEALPYCGPRDLTPLQLWRAGA